MSKLEGSLPYIGLLAFASMALTRVCDPMLTAMRDDFQVTVQQVSHMVSWYAVAYGVLQLFYGPLGDRFGKLRIVLWAGIVCAVLCVAAAFSTSFAVLIFVRIAMGASAAAIIPLSIAWIGDLIAYANRQETLARLMVASVSGMMAGQLLGGVAAGQFGWRWAFAVLSLVFLLATTVLFNRTLPLLREDRHATRAATSPLAFYVINSVALMRDARVRWVLAVSALEGGLALGPLAFAPGILADRFGYSVSMAGALMMLYGVGGLIYAGSAKRWLKLLGERGLAAVGGTLLAASLLIFGWARQPVLGAVACTAGGLGFYMLHNTMQTQATQMAAEARGTAVALFVAFLFIGQSIGVSIVAPAIQSYEIEFPLSCAAVGILMLGFFVSTKVQRA